MSAAPALAQTPLAPTPVAAPDQSSAIPLGPVRRRAPSEQWEIQFGQRVVRNVVTPTLTPVLPDPSRATGAAVIIAPGGGFMFISMDNEGYPVARWLADRGIAAFILKYRTRETPRDPAQYQASLIALMSNLATSPASGDQPPVTVPSEAIADAESAIRLVRSRAQNWGIDPNRVGFLGFSAGAMTTLKIATTQDMSARPNFIAPIYGFMDAMNVPADAPPMFTAVALDDALMAHGRSLALIESWRNAGRPVEAHLYERGGHGFGMMGTGRAAALWIDQFYAWMQDRGIIPRAP